MLAPVFRSSNVDTNGKDEEMIDITPKTETRVGRVLAHLKAWDEAIHADPAGSSEVGHRRAHQPLDDDRTSCLGGGGTGPLGL